MKIHLYIIFIVSYLFVNTSFYSDSKVFISSPADNNKDSTISVTISVVGDLMCHSPQYEYARVDKDSFDFRPVFREVKSLLSKSDFTFGNLETVTAGKETGGYSGYPKFNTPASYIDALADAGFDLLITSNNHSLDRGEVGVIKTIDQINKFNLARTGTFISQEDRDSIRIINLKGIKIAVISYSYGTNGNPIPKGKNYLINLINFDLIQKDIEQARKKYCDVVIVNYHFGEEYKREPVQSQKEVVDKTISLGADIIIGGHPHVIQPVDFFKTNNASLDTGFVAYSMGNFISNQRKRYTDGGMILTLTLSKNINTGVIKLTSVNIIPTWVFKGLIENQIQYLIIPSIADKNNLLFLDKKDSTDMMRAYADTREIVKKYTTNPILQEE